MRLLELKENGELSLALFNNNIPPYAILSHTWGDDEVSFSDVEAGKGQSKAGYHKIRFCGEQAARDGLKYFWVDTCSINKSDFTELSEAINSMFRWYRDSTRCYVYLSDVPYDRPTWESTFRQSRWFTRAWTLQELLAPRSVEFFSQDDVRLGDKTTLERHIHEVTGIAISALQGISLSQFSVGERFSWAETRQATREEDEAYSLLGIFGVHMPLIYGEGRASAFKRLREEVDKVSKRTHMMP